MRLLFFSIVGEEKIRNNTQDALILDGLSRSIIPGPSRDELKPRRSAEKREKQPKNKGMDR